MSGHDLNDLKAFLPDLPSTDDEPVFAEPWEAEAFALVVSMHEQGLFDWKEWAEILGRTIAEDTGGKSYYELWLEALERLLTGKSVLQPAELSERKIAWEEAVARTPHGMPITLESSH